MAKKKIQEIPVHISQMRSVFYTNIDPRRMPELMDSHMVHADHNAMANLPEQGYQRQFPKNYTPYFSFNNDVIGE